MRWLPAVLWMAVIFAVSSLTGSQVPGRFSVAGHLGEYAVLGALLLWAYGPSAASSATSALRAFVIAVLYGAGDEIHQLFVAGRTSDPLDWATDAAGAAAGILLLAAWLTRSRIREPQ